MSKAKTVSNDLDADKLKFFLEYIPPRVSTRVRRTIRKASTLYENERHFEVYYLLQRIMKECDMACVTLPQTLEGEVVTNRARAITHGTPQATLLSTCLFKRFVERSVMYQTSKARVEAAQKLIDSVKSTGEWAAVSTGEGEVGTFYRKDAEKDIHYFKVISVLDVNAIYVCGIIMELDLFSEWFPLCEKSISTGDLSRFYRTSYFLMKAMWPVANRDIFMKGFGIDDLDNNARLVIVAESLDENKELPEGVQRPPPSTSDNVRCEVQYGGFLIELVAPEKTKLSFIMAIDPKIPSIPQKFLNWINGKVMWQMTKEIEKAALRSREKTSKYYQRRREKPEVYDLFRTRFNDCIEKKFPDAWEQYKLDEDY